MDQLILLFADAPAPAGPSDGKMAFLMAIATLLGGMMTKAADVLWQSYQNRRACADKRELSVNQHLQLMNQRIDHERLAAEEESKKLSRRVRRLEITCTALKMHSRGLERVLINNKLSFESFQEPDLDEGEPDTIETKGSATHTPLPPGSGT